MSQDHDRKVVDAEIINPESGERTRWYYETRTVGSPGTMWVASPIARGGCLPAAITFFLFFVCLGQYGLLAGIGFLVFHIIGSVLGSVYQARKLMVGIITSPWTWRIGNWLVSFLLTVWLAGGFNE